MKKVMVVFGTRPEAIKMAPVVAALRSEPHIDTRVAVTAQHRHMLDQVLEVFSIKPDHDLDVMQAGQSLPRLFAAVLTGMTEVFKAERPSLVLVHGDTTTSIASALAAFFSRIPVAHVEAGLRSGNLAAPWPEEANRRLTASLAAVHFAPTARARDNLLAENISPDKVHVTGNTVIDALLDVASRLEKDAALRSAIEQRFPFLRPARRLILVTGHRRENFGDGVREMCIALQALAARGDVQVVYPVHLNPSVQEPVTRLLNNTPGVELIDPLEYVPFVYLMSRADLIITDSGGIQEEAPSLGKPVLVMRDSTERPEAVEAGTVRLVGARANTIIETATELLDDPEAYASMARAHNPYGDGSAATRIARLVRDMP